MAISYVVFHKFLFLEHLKTEIALAYHKQFHVQNCDKPENEPICRYVMTRKLLITIRQNVSYSKNIKKTQLNNHKKIVKNTKKKKKNIKKAHL